MRSRLFDKDTSSRFRLADDALGPLRPRRTLSLTDLGGGQPQPPEPGPEPDPDLPPPMGEPPGPIQTPPGGEPPPMQLSQPRRRQGRAGTR